MTPRITAWNRFLRYATRLIGSATRISLAVLIIGAPFSPELKFGLACGLSLFLALALVGEGKTIYRIESTAPQDFGPGQVRLSRPLDLESKSRLLAAVLFHLVVGFAGVYASMFQPALSQPVLLLWGLSACIAAFRHVAFYVGSEQREYLVVPAHVWQEAKEIVERHRGIEGAEKVEAYWEAAQRWDLKPRARIFLFSLVRNQDKLQVETADDDA